METPDGDIYEGIQRGDPRAVGKLFDRYERRIYRYLYARTFRQEAAEDLCSQTFLKAIEAIDRFEPRGRGFAPWLYSIARNLLIDHVRKSRGKASQPGIEAIERMPGSENIEGGYERAEQAAEIRKAVSELAPEKREIVLLRTWEDMSYDDIADIVGKTAAHCRTIYHRSMKELRTLLAATLIMLLTTRVRITK